MIAYLTAIGIVALIYALLALGLNLQFGLTRLVNFGVVAFFAIGAYTSALLALKGVPLVVTFSAATLLAGLSALPIGLLSLRLRDDYLAIVTLGFSESLRITIQQEEWLTKGVQGVPGIPKLFGSLGPGVSDSAQLLLLVAITALVAGGIEVAEYTALQVKQAVVGNGHADKKQVLHMVRRLLSLPGDPSPDAADALACAIAHEHGGQGLGTLSTKGMRVRNGRMIASK